jgi:hypothetical protein
MIEASAASAGGAGASGSKGTKAEPESDSDSDEEEEEEEGEKKGGDKKKKEANRGGKVSGLRKVRLGAFEDTGRCKGCVNLPFYLLPLHFFLPISSLRSYRSR